MVVSVLQTTSGSRSSVVLLRPWGYQALFIGAFLVLPDLHSVRFIILGFFDGGYDPYSLDVLGHGRPGANEEAPNNP